MGMVTYYYWLSCSAYFTGHENFARMSWKKLLEINPDKAGSEPWNQHTPNGLDEQSGVIFQKIDSDYIEERLFAIFLSKCFRKEGRALFIEAIFQK